MSLPQGKEPIHRLDLMKLDMAKASITEIPPLGIRGAAFRSL
jgi:hypothetical protein